jgi:hypothetical protein
MTRLGQPAGCPIPAVDQIRYCYVFFKTVAALFRASAVSLLFLALFEACQEQRTGSLLLSAAQAAYAIGARFLLAYLFFF